MTSILVQASRRRNARLTVQSVAVGCLLLAAAVSKSNAAPAVGCTAHGDHGAAAELRSCSGDCSGDGTVEIHELVTLIRTAADSSSPAVCAAGDRDGNGEIAIAEIVRAVQSSLIGCESRRIDDIVSGWAPIGSPGAIVLVADRGRVVHKAAYGLADVEAGIENTTQTLFPVASISKMFSGLALMRLVEDGLLDYDAPVADYLPELAHLGNDLTLRNLLQHTGGLPDYFDVDIFLSITGLPIEDLICAGENYGVCPAEYDRCTAASLPVTPQRTLEVLSALDAPLFTPGSSFRYSSPGSELIGLIVERVSGQPYKDFVRERVFAPAGMHRTVAGADADALADPELSRGYTRATCPDGFVGWQPYHLTEATDLPASGLSFSTVDDLYALDQALYAGTIVSRETLAASVAAAVESDETGIHYAFGAAVVDPDGSHVMAILGGFAGHVTALLRFPDRHLTVIVALNREDLTTGTWQSELDLIRPIAEIYMGKSNAS
jgi:CubicO group peptidase (beta-lactamase class C family)